MTNEDKSYDTSYMMGSNEEVNRGLIDNHIFFLSGDINGINSGEAIKWILYENTIKEDKELTLYINSDGGDMIDTFALIDIMKNSRYKIRTIGIGSIGSAAFLIFSCGKKGSRIISRNASILSHQFSWGGGGKMHDMESHLKEFKLMKNRILNTLIESTGLSAETIIKELIPPTDVWLTPEELVKYGVADIIS